MILEFAIEGTLDHTGEKKGKSLIIPPKGSMILYKTFEGANVKGRVKDVSIDYVSNTSMVFITICKTHHKILHEVILR